MTLEDAIKRIEELELKVRMLEARPVLVPISIPVPAPMYPSFPVYQPWQPYSTTCGIAYTGGGTGHISWVK